MSKPNVSPEMQPQVVGSKLSAWHWLVVGLLVLLLLLAGVYDEYVFAFFTAMWHKVFAALGLSQQADALQHGIHRRVTRRPLPAVATYAVLYVGACLLLLRLLLRDPAQWRLTLRLYAGVVVAYLLIVVIGKLAGDAIWAYRLSRHLIDFVVSPLPVAGLLVLFRAGLGPRSSGQTQP
jgi:uncharacterized integral membrane protein